MLVAVTRLTVMPEYRDELRRRWLEVASASIQSPGCLGVRLFQDIQDPNDLTILGEYKDLAALEAQLASPLIKDLLADIPSITEGEFVNRVVEEIGSAGVD